MDEKKISLKLKHISQSYIVDNKVFDAVVDVSLDVYKSEFLVVLGPGRCGKTVLLNMIAGLEKPVDGEILLDGEALKGSDERIGMVFQNYALYPHMTVYDNMAFALKLRKVPKDEIDKKVREAAKILDLEHLLDRKPKALSGGQRQRVAMGRAIVRSPKVFLMDEPLSNLDAKLRVQMRSEISKLHHKLQTTFIYVTHDQTEAMTLGTRIVVLKDGIIQQVDTPQNLYNAPDNLFVAGFIGSPQMNFIDATISKDDKGVYTNFGEYSFKLPESKAKALTEGGYVGKTVILGIRPEDIHNEDIFLNTSPESIVDAEVEVTELLGAELNLYTFVGGQNVTARVNARTNAKIGDKLKLAFDLNRMHFFDKETEQNICH